MFMELAKRSGARFKTFFSPRILGWTASPADVPLPQPTQDPLDQDPQVLRDLQDSGDLLMHILQRWPGSICPLRRRVAVSALPTQLGRVGDRDASVETDLETYGYLYGLTYNFLSIVARICDEQH